MTKEDASLEFRLEKWTKQETIFWKKQNNELISKKHKKTCGNLNYVENLLILASTVTGCVPISAFSSLVGIPTGIASSAIGLKI